MSDSIHRTQSKNDTQSFLGHLVYISAYILNFCLISAQITQLLTEGGTFQLAPELQHAFEGFQYIELEFIIKFITLHPFQNGLSTKITTDASMTAIGAPLW